ncbi:ergothioneine biosynthesis protein EgtB [Marinibaculum pumilum]|uniref:Ergothioneine biosynthesis protein EgtB n=1 Tax=Marinibaculum pumilum TaxID=1766165 RepID=A0ABV7L8B2_9PROT
MSEAQVREAGSMAIERIGAGSEGVPLAERFDAVRRRSLQLVAPLSAEDMVVQSMTDASPAKWHLAHTTWFFETFLLQPSLAGYDPFDPSFGYLFNSYYETVGARHPRPARGMLTRPSVDRVFAYRDHVDAAMRDLIDARTAGHAELRALVELGLHHEEQHQELLLTDLLHAFSCNPTDPAYLDTALPVAEGGPQGDGGWADFEGGIVRVGHDGNGFAFDCEGPLHEVLLRPFQLARRPVSNAQWRAFMEDGGYRRPEFWLSDGWARAQEEGWQAPLYWRDEGQGEWSALTLRGRGPVDPSAPVAHVSYYEADAFARWAGARLPTEAEWEHAAQHATRSASRGRAAEGNTLGSGALQPRAVGSAAEGPLQQMFGDVWEWTQTAYAAYPGFRPATGAVGEYNGKFMCNQMTLRGGSCVTPDDHVRPSYRNFFYPHQRWQVMGLRLAGDA